MDMTKCALVSYYQSIAAVHRPAAMTSDPSSVFATSVEHAQTIAALLSRVRLVGIGVECLSRFLREVGAQV